MSPSNYGAEGDTYISDDKLYALLERLVSSKIDASRFVGEAIRRNMGLPCGTFKVARTIVIPEVPL